MPSKRSGAFGMLQGRERPNVDLNEAQSKSGDQETALEEQPIAEHSEVESSGSLSEEQVGTDGVQSVYRVHWSELYSGEQVRKSFEGIDELAQSISQHGLDDPIKVHPKDDNGYLIRRGERRWRACKQLDADVDIIIVDPLDDASELIMMITENLQREDLKPLELANAYAQLMSGHSMRQADIAKTLGKSKAHVSKMVNLLSLPEETQALADNNLVNDPEVLNALGKLSESDPDTYAAFCHRAQDDEAASLSRKEVLEALKKATNASKPPETGDSKSSQNEDGDSETEEVEEPEVSFRLRNPAKIAVVCSVADEGIEGRLRLDLDPGDECVAVVEYKNKAGKDIIENFPVEKIRIQSVR